MNLLHSFKHPLALLGLLLVGGWVLIALFAPWIAPHDPLESFTPLLTPMTVGDNGQSFLLGQASIRYTSWFSEAVYSSEPKPL